MPGLSPGFADLENSVEQAQSLVSVVDVTFGYEEEVILDRVSLEIGAQDFLAIIGPNGGGKTTLLKIILGLLRPWSGWVELGISGKEIGYVPQFAGFDKSFPLQVFDVVRLGRLGDRGPLRRYSREDNRRVEEVLDRFDLSSVARETIDSLSGGQLQRTLIARALVSEPKILFLDEPLGSVDPESRQVVLGTLEELNRSIPVVVITHDITLFAGMIKQVACINRELFYHPGAEVTPEILEKVYGCPVELVAHGVPHRVLGEHQH